MNTRSKSRKKVFIPKKRGSRSKSRSKNASKSKPKKIRVPKKASTKKARAKKASTKKKNARQRFGGRITTWAEAMGMARKKLNIQGFVPCGGNTSEGQELLHMTRELYDGRL